jgi:O-acetyl-ADP-ribose deacetylase (regulator of RNase III)
VITFVRGDLFNADVDALVNPVNTVAVMGKGLALIFRRRYPANYESYAAACRSGQVQTGRVYVTESDVRPGPRWIINLPTKQDWRKPSQLQWITDGLLDLRRFLERNDVRSVAIPALGAGLGGLAWPVVRREIEAVFAALPSVDVQVFEPH